MEKTIYDADPSQECATGTCPKFVVNDETQIVTLIDKQGNRANMSIEHFNKFIKAARSGEMSELPTKSILRK